MPNDQDDKPKDDSSQEVKPEGQPPQEPAAQQAPTPPEDEPKNIQNEEGVPQQALATQPENEPQELTRYEGPMRPALPLLFSQKDILLIILTILLIVTVGYLFNNRSSGPQTITVIGSASQDINADSAIVKAVITTRGANKTRITQTNINDVHRVKTELAVLGITSDKIQEKSSYTGSLSAELFPVPSSATCQDNNCPTIAANPTIDPVSPAVTELTITLNAKDIDKMEQIRGVLDNYTQDIYESYEFKDREKLEAESKEKALQNARQQAENIAKNSKATVKNVITVKDLSPTAKSVEAPTKTTSLKTSYEVTYEIGSSFLPF